MKNHEAFVFDTKERKFKPKKISVENGLFSAVSDISATTCRSYIVPGLIDVHTHGRCGYDIMEASAEKLSMMSLEYAKVGTTALFPTVMTAPTEKIKSAIDNIMRSDVRGARFLGVHVEGPYISEKKPGCHNVCDIRMPDRAEITELINMTAPKKAHFTVAPEKCPEGLIAELSKSATIGVGHTAANFCEAMRAVGNGAVSFTHTFNAMTGISHREPGTAGAALYSDAYAEFIADGIHVSPEVIAIAYRAKQAHKDKFVLITDSLPPAGLPDGRYEMNGIGFNLIGKSAKRDDGTIVGSVIDMLTALKNLSKFADITFEEALICATKAPAEMVGIYDSVGSIDVGKYADFLILDENKNITSVFIGGERII